MTVYFIGAGPGAYDLITIRGYRVIRSAEVILYAGSLVPEDILKEVSSQARVLNTASMNLDEIVNEMKKAHSLGKDVARIHSGDPSLYGATGEQMRRLDRLKVAYEVIPGVPAYAAAAAVLKQELTLPEVSQTVILTRTGVRSSSMPALENLENLGKIGATLVIHLSINNLQQVVRELTPCYGPECPVVVLYRVSWPDQQIIKGRLDSIRDLVKKAGITRTALILVGPVLAAAAFSDSRLYDRHHTHLFRQAEERHRSEGHRSEDRGDVFSD